MSSTTPSSLPARLPSRRLPAGARAAATAALAAGLLLVPVAAASAHVHVTPDTTAAGSYALLDVRVPNESATASTTKVELTLPTDHPFTYAAVQPVPGWTAQVTEEPLATPVVVEGTTLTKAPRTITWTAQAGAGIAPGQFQQFPVSVGALPAAGTTVQLPATQTYSDGTVVAWDQPVPANGAEPENPAPEFTTTAAASGHHHDDESTSATASASGASGTGDAGASAGGTSAGTWLGATGALLGAVALVVSLVRRRPAAVTS
ncbi:YcnI family copper-binding membrane protein [Quadrisphaera setariae]|uniref:YcnI family copper-binding membrane protein n=1 Tax=Quadrisphaera setariae TaxID=2593304 RepID=UPI001C9D42CD|nr:YcnI family protein [Quadrisphaera setariae]